MRINRLDLTRYGIFSDYSIDFRERKDGVPDLHVIYGLNETGKSTALAAFLDLLFGIETRSPYDFLHPYQTMRIGGVLEIGGRSRRFSRIKRAQNSLLDGNDKPIADNIILSDLGGIERKSYTTMFSLNDDTLEEGGESILASEGDLGQLLFSASSGLSDLGRTLASLQTEAEQFYKFRTRKSQLSNLKTRLGELKKERADIDTVASEYARLITARDQFTDQYEKAMAERSQIQTKIDELEGQLRALPKLAELRKIREHLKPLSGIPETPPDWSDELPKLKEDDDRLEFQAEGIEHNIKTISAELDGIVLDESALKLANDIDLLENSHARYLTADRDLPDRRLQQKEADFAISETLRRIECETISDPNSLLLSVSVTGALRDLMEKRSGVDTAMETAEEELDGARRRLDQAKKKLETGAGDGQKSGDGVFAYMQTLKSALSIARDDDHALRRRRAEQSRKEHMEAVAERMFPLRPWTGDAEDLRKLSIPETGDIELWKNSISEIRKRGEGHEGEIERLTADQRRLKAEVEAISQVAGVVSDQEATKARAVREEAWASHKRILDEESAGVFEAALRHDDIVINSRIGHAAEAAKLNQNSQTLAVVGADLETARKGLDAAAKELKTVQSKIAAAIRMMTPSLPEDMSLSQLEAWLDRREKTLESFNEAEKADRETEAAEKDGERIRSKLLKTASAAGINFEPDASIDTLISLAQETLNRETELEALRSEITERANDADTRAHKVEKEKKAEKDWDRRWAELCAGCWLGSGGSIPTIPTVREILNALDELVPVVKERNSLAGRIKKMEDDQRRFTEEVETLAKKLRIDTMSPPLELDARLKKTIDEAKSAQEKHKEISERLGEAKERKRTINEERKIHSRRKTEMLEHFKVDSLLEVGAKLRQVEKRDGFRNREEKVEQEILDALGAQSIDAAENLLGNVDRNAVNSEIEELKGHFENQDQLTRELFSKYKQASQQVEAVGGDNAAAKIEEKRRLVMLEVEDGAFRYLRLKLGIVAAEQALRIYRDRHRSSMMDRASEAFQTISRGAYKGLRTQPEKDSEILIAVGADDGSKIVSDLSKGTRFQLYLALRVAGYHEFVQSRQPVPFIADDIMETFDDFRAEEAFRLFAEMAEAGQVIYLTHHKHLCEIARRVCPEVQVHELVISSTRRET